jgi:molecular chaperone IbpA
MDASGYPPYNIEVTGEDQYRISLAVAGFSTDELDIEVKEGKLKVSGKKADSDTARQYLHRGIANRGFERVYQLADYVRVAGAEVKDGLLHIDLLREIPEAMKPRRISIRNSDTLIENHADDVSKVGAA